MYEMSMDAEKPELSIGAKNKIQYRIEIKFL